jgi:hypothetical protein
MSRSMKPGANKNEGYWINAHVIIQLENVADVSAIMIPDVQHIAMYDNSQGHCLKQDGGLDASRMNWSFGGVQPKMDLTESFPANAIRKFIGEFRNAGCLAIGARQSFCFDESSAIFMMAMVLTG